MTASNASFLGGIAPFLLLIPPAWGGEENVRFIEIPGTRSPDQQLAIAWGMTGEGNLVVSDSGVVFARAEPGKVRNYLVDRRSRTILATLHTRFSEGVRPGRSDDLEIETLWFPDGSAVIVSETGEGVTGSIDLVLLPELKVIDLGDSARSVFARRIREEWLFYPMEDIRMKFSGFRFAGPDRVRLVAHAEPSLGWMPCIIQDFTAVWHGGDRISFHESN